MEKCKVFAGRPVQELAAEVCSRLGMAPGQADIFTFSNDNTFVRILETVRECDVFVLQTSTPPVDQNLMETLILIDALRRASAQRITAVLPYYPYVRSDKKDQPRVPITARLVADLLTTAGADRVVTMDLTAAQIQGFFRIPVDHLTALPLLCDYFVAKGLARPVVVAPDAGSAKWAARYAERLHAPLVLLDKRRLGNSGEVRIAGVVGDVTGGEAIIFDDEIDRGGSVTEAARVLIGHGARAVYAGCTHGVLSGPAVERIAASPLTEVVVTNTVPIPAAKRIPQLTVLSVADLLAQAIRGIHVGESISPLFR
ncbi:MAG: ribose-phosphate diphosphokinase [Symbiobacteriia bacterium]